MKNIRPFVAGLAATSMLASSLLATPVAAQRVEVGNAASVVGDVELSNDQIRRPRQVERRDRIAWGDLIETGRRSQMQILLLDRSNFGIGARSSMRIDRFVYDPEEGRSLFATFVKGALRFFSGRQDERNNAEIQTPAGRIGIRGTALDVLVGERAEDIAEDEDFVGRVRSDDDEATLVVLRGPGAQTAGGLTTGLVDVEGAGVTVTLDEPGLAAYIPYNGAAPIGPFRISNSGLSAIQDRLAPSVARAADSGGSFLDTLLPLAIGAAVVGGIILLDGDDDNDAGPNAGGSRPGSVPPTAGVPPGQNPTGQNPTGQSPNSQDPCAGLDGVALRTCRARQNSSPNSIP